MPIRVAAPLPTVVRVGERLTTHGHARGAPPGSIAELERQPITGGGWRVLARTGLHRGRFTLSWLVAPRGIDFASVRVVIVRRGRILARTTPQQLLIGQAPSYCAPAPAPTSVPPGDGVIVGGAYDAGGPAPGIYACLGSPYTVTLANAAGSLVLSEQIAGGHGYAFVVAAGSYTLSSGGVCRGEASVIAGGVTKADTVCAVP